MTAKETTDNLVERLSGEWTPVRRLAHPLRRALPWSGLAFAYLFAAVAVLGIRPDVELRLQEPHFLLETGLMLAVSVSAFFGSAWLCVPDMRGAKGLMTALPLTLMAVFVFWVAVRGMTEGVALPPPRWDHCFGDGLLMGAVPAAGVMLLCRPGATTAPRLMAAMNLLAVGALAYVGLRFTCMADAVGHAVLSHLLPFILLGVLLGAAARFVYRW